MEIENNEGDEELLLDLNQAAKLLGFGRHSLIELLKKKQILITDGTPYQRYIDSSYFALRERHYRKGFTLEDYLITLVTPKGLNYLKKFVKKLSTRMKNQFGYRNNAKGVYIDDSCTN